ncbi:hypothetical protein [Fimbriimonas ginsengisoli]
MIVLAGLVSSLMLPDPWLN